MFVTPYPPGFPILVPGQVVTDDILAFMSALDTREIHGYLPEFGYRVFTESAMQIRRDQGPAKVSPQVSWVSLRSRPPETPSWPMWR